MECNFLLAEEELRGLTHLNGNAVIHSRQRTFIIGYISNMKASISLANEMFSQRSCAPHYLLLYKLSQDAIEHFFGDIRSRGHWCINPTPLYFMHGYRALVSNRLKLYGLSQGRNCTELNEVEENDCSDLLPVHDGVDLDMEQQHWENILGMLHGRNAGTLRQNILYYMAGWAVRQALKVLFCEECKAALVTLEPHQDFLSRLTMAKQRGGLLYASRSAYRVVLLADRALEHELIKLNNSPPRHKQFLDRLIFVVFRACSVDRLIFNDLVDHDCSNFLDQHVPFLIKLLAGKYLKARLGHLGKLFTEKQMGAASSRRNQRTRGVIFNALRFLSSLFRLSWIAL